VLSNAGDQEPLIPFVEVVGKGDKVPPKQITGIGKKVGVILELTIIVVKAVVAHCPELGVKV
jgi:hypothetical protein